MTSTRNTMQRHLDTALGALNESCGVEVPVDRSQRFLRVYGPRGIYETPPLTPADLRKPATVLTETADWLEQR